MRRIFEQLPYFLPAEPAPFARLFLTEGIRREVAKGELLKRGGESQRLFFLESGLCAYYAAEAENHRPTILSVLLPGRAMGDLTASVGTRCNVFTRALEKGVVRVVPPAVLTAALMKDPALAQLEIRSVIAKEESILEGMTANFIRPPAERIVICAKALCRAKNVSPSSGWHRLPLTISAERIGEIVNLNRVSVARQMSSWMKADLVRRDGRKLLFSDQLFAAVDDWIENPVPKCPLPA